MLRGEAECLAHQLGEDRLVSLSLGRSGDVRANAAGTVDLDRRAVVAADFAHAAPQERL